MDIDLNALARLLGELIEHAESYRDAGDPDSPDASETLCVVNRLWQLEGLINPRRLPFGHTDRGRFSGDRATLLYRLRKALDRLTVAMKAERAAVAEAAELMRRECCNTLEDQAPPVILVEHLKELRAIRAALSESLNQHTTKTEWSEWAGPKQWASVMGFENGRAFTRYCKVNDPDQAWHQKQTTKRYRIALSHLPEGYKPRAKRR